MGGSTSLLGLARGVDHGAAAGRNLLVHVAAALLSARSDSAFLFEDQKRGVGAFVEGRVPVRSFAGALYRHFGSSDLPAIPHVDAEYVVRRRGIGRAGVQPALPALQPGRS